jgi:hypothetical protein
LPGKNPGRNVELSAAISAIRQKQQGERGGAHHQGHKDIDGERFLCGRQFV